MDEQTFYIDEKKETASQELACLLQKCIRMVDRPWRELVFLCIGSDRITGDSLGPLVGHLLTRHLWQHSFIYGTLDEPIHALNLTGQLEKIKKKHPSALIVAVDASLGSQKHVGYITVGLGPIHPGAGVRKTLPDVGDIFITGIINASGTLEHFLLQTTRLSTVISMADSITQGILLAFSGQARALRFRPEELLPQEEPCLLRCWAKDSALAAFSMDTASGEGTKRS